MTTTSDKDKNETALQLALQKATTSAKAVKAKTTASEAPVDLSAAANAPEISTPGASQHDIEAMHLRMDDIARRMERTEKTSSEALKLATSANVNATDSRATIRVLQARANETKKPSKFMAGLDVTARVIGIVAGGVAIAIGSKTLMRNNAHHNNGN